MPAVEAPATAQILPSTIPPIDLAPIRKFVSEAWLDERRWTAETNGAIFEEDGECIAPIGFLDALRALIAGYHVVGARVQDL
jgi:hypothetical protein